VRANGGQAEGKVRHYVFVALVFLMARAFALECPVPADLRFYACFAQEHVLASREGTAFYDYHAEAVEREIEAARASGHLTRPWYEHKDVEYPPLMITVLQLPLLGMSPAADASLPSEVFDEKYRVPFRWGMVGVDLLLFAALAWLAHRLFPLEGPEGNGRRLLVYIACTTALWPQLYDRLDPLQTLLVLAALALLVSRWHYAWSFAVLAVAINLKLVPLVLAPVWVVGSLRGDRPAVSWRPRVVAPLLARGALLAGMVVAIFLPFYLSAGGQSLAFLRYHRERTLEIESMWSCVPLTLRAFGYPARGECAYGGVSIDSPLTPLLCQVATVSGAVLMLAATAPLLVRARRLTGGTDGSDRAGASLARLYPAEFACYAQLFLALFVSANKVFAPQYLLWLAPLAVLVPFGPPARWVFLATFGLICVLTTVLMPFLFLIDLSGASPPDAVPPLVNDATPRFVAVLLARNLLFLGWTVGLAIYLVRRALGGITPSGCHAEKPGDGCP
jgi:hypothetical protein